MRLHLSHSSFCCFALQRLKFVLTLDDYLDLFQDCRVRVSCIHTHSQTLSSRLPKLVYCRRLVKLSADRSLKKAKVSEKGKTEMRLIVRKPALGESVQLISAFSFAKQSNLL